MSNDLATSNTVNLLLRNLPKSPLSRTKRLAARLGKFVPKIVFQSERTISELLQDAESEAEICELLRNGNNQRPSGKTRRQWLRIAKEKRASFAS